MPLSLVPLLMLARPGKCTMIVNPKKVCTECETHIPHSSHTVTPQISFSHSKKKKFMKDDKYSYSCQLGDSYTCQSEISGPYEKTLEIFGHF